MDSCVAHGPAYIAMWGPHRILLLGRYRLVKNPPPFILHHKLACFIDGNTGIIAQRPVSEIFHNCVAIMEYSGPRSELAL